MQSSPFKIIEIINNRLVLNSEGLLKIKQIKGRIFPVCVVGPILTGKSSLLNQIIGKEVFKVGSTTMAMTKGVNAYLRQISVGKQNQIWQLIMDVQGFDDSFNAGDEEIDIRLLSLLISICKVVMYNSFGALDSKIFERIASICKSLPENLKHEPDFILVQRDFALRLQTCENQSLSSDEYLDHFMKHYKDKAKINTLTQTFKRNLKRRELQISNKIHNMKCCLVSHPSEVQYKKSAHNLRQQIASKMFISCINSQEEPWHTIQFVYTLAKSIELLSERSLNLGSLYCEAQKFKQQQVKSWITLYKSTLSQKCRKQLKPNLPIPEQLLSFKFKILQQQSIHQLQSEKNEQAFILQAIGSEKLEEYNSKTLDKVRKQNNSRTREFIQLKIKQLVSPQNQTAGQQQLSNIQPEQMMSNLQTYYSFIGPSHIDYIKYNIYRELYSKFKSKYQWGVANCQENRKANETQKGKIQKLEIQLEEKSKVIKRLSEENRNLKQQSFRYSQQVKETSEYASKEISKFHKMMEQNSQVGQNMLKQIKNQLRQNLTYEKQPKQPKLKQTFPSKQQDAGNESSIMQSINQIICMVASSNNERHKQEKNQSEKIILLEQMNKNLRQRIQQLLSSNSYAGMIESKYNQLMIKLQGKQKQLRAVILEKNSKIEQLNHQLRNSISINTCLQQEIKLLREKANDKIKSSEFLEKVLQTKQASLSQLRTQLLESMNKYTTDLNAVKREYCEKEAELTKNITALLVKNEQITRRNEQLERKMMGIEGKYRKELEDKLLQKESIINKQEKRIFQLESRLQSNIEQYTKMSKDIQRILNEKDQNLLAFSQEIQALESKISSISSQLQKSRQSCESLKQKITKLQIQREELQSKIKRQQILTSNRIKHMQHSNQKLKVEMKQKENTFDMMLLQLRTTNILTNNLNGTNNLMKEESKKKYMKRIDYIEQIALRELDEISNRSKSKNRTNGQFQSRYSLTTNINRYPYAKSECQQHFAIQNMDIKNSGDKLRLQYETDRKPKKSVKFLELTDIKNENQREKNLNNSSLSSGFKTVAKRL